MHDLWPFTGGCHYPGACQGYVARCGRCPLLGAKREDDLSRSGWQRRADALRRKEVTFVAPSRWLAAVAGTSSLLRARAVRVIPNGVDDTVFAPRERGAERMRWGLPARKLLLLAGSARVDDNPRKGYPDLVAALALLPAALREQMELVLFGSASAGLTSVAGFRVHAVGTLADEEALASVYAAADFFVAPSREDNLPNTVVEALAAGTPVVAYATGGIPEIVTHEQTGLLVPTADITALAAAIARMVADAPWREACRLRARESFLQRFRQADSARAYDALYRELCALR
jgi:glycosyltransferase involved in cell wall biosynthesis